MVRLGPLTSCISTHLHPPRRDNFMPSQALITTDIAALIGANSAYNKTQNGHKYLSSQERRSAWG
jgi:hypothetical protein